jgi:hypothetical protein
MKQWLLVTIVELGTGIQGKRWEGNIYIAFPSFTIWDVRIYGHPVAS